MTTFRGTWLSFALLAGTLVGASARAANTADLRVYQHADGQRYFALSLTADLPVTTTEPRDVVLLFDTSASQTGMYRDTAFAALESWLASLTPRDRVKLVAVDLEPRPLQTQFAAPQGAETKQAVETLRKDSPLGATDLPLALQTATEWFDKDGSHDRVLIYLGDGMSMAQIVGPQTLSKVVEKLRANHIAVSSYAIGPARDNQLLAVIANQTGGNLYIDEGMTWADDKAEITAERATAENARRGTKIGRSLAEWVRSPVVWSEIAMPSQFATMLPTRSLPLRGDRDTVFVGRLNKDAGSSLTITASTQKKDSANYRWECPISEPQTSYSYLSEMVSLAERDGGLTLPTLGTRGLDETGRLLLARVESLTDLAQQAVSTGDLESAQQLSDAILVRDPGNPRAETVQRVIKKNRVPAKPMAHKKPAGEGDLQLVRPAQFSNPMEIAPGDEVILDGNSAAPSVTDGRFLDQVEQQNRVFAEMLKKQVENDIRNARDIMSSEPDQATQELKMALQSVERAPELIAAVRAQLIDRLQSTLREVARAAAIKDDIDREREEELAAAREMRLLTDRLQQRMEREAQLMDRFNALMDEGRYEEAQEVAAIVKEIDPEGAIPVSAEVFSQLKRNYELQQVTREARWRGFWETMYQIELSSVPFPDNPPIVYPPAPFWEELTNRRKKYAAVDLKAQGGAEQKITEALTSPLPAAGLDFPATPLEEIIQALRDEYEIEIQVDKQALEDLGIDLTTPIDVNLRNISLRSALRLMLKDLELTYIIADEVLLITTQEEADTRLSVRVYPVADLVLPIITPPPGGGGLGGQSGGLGGGGGGGFGGGGQGGGGFGGGGGGFGGGGGGQFSVPEDAAPQQELTLTKSKPSTKAQETPTPVITKTQPRPVAPQAAAIKIDEAAAPEQFWSEYFGHGMRDTAQVRQAVRDLMRDGRYDHVIALVHAALRNGQPQPWMYEALGISMQMSGRPKADIERAIMSAVDFSSSPEEMMLVARYLSGMDLDRRAVRVYQQIVAMDPLMYEAYALALRSAQRADDFEGIRFATVGILGQAWPTKQVDIENVARRVAKATLAQLQEAGKTELYEAYRAELNQSLARDCVIRVSWTGEADIDLAVEEPAGTICSALQPRTTSGGVALGDSFAVGQEPTKDGYSEAYVCPRGFAGTYRAQVRRVWGDVAAGKVTVDVYLNLGKEGYKHERQQIALEDGQAVVMFELPAGSRVEPLAEQQLARAVDRQHALGRAVMGQQLANNRAIGSLSDPSAIPDRGRFDPRQALFGRGGAVGFQPVITVLPEGTNFFATGVVSADRRYVRITSVPFFSSIGDVTTFTFAGASRNDTGGGGGNDPDPPAPPPGGGGGGGAPPGGGF